MPQPTASLATLRPELGATLEEFDLAADREGFIGHRILPVFEAGEESGKFGKIPVEQLLQSPETRRAPGTGYGRGNWKFTTDSYACEEHGWEEPVDDREAKVYANYFDAEVVSAARALDIVLRNHEIRIATAIFNSSTWTPTSVTNEWDDASNATPLTDVETAVQAVHAACGMWPNALIINRKVFRNLRNVDQIVDRVKYQGYMDARAGNITAQAMAEAFDLDQIIIAGSSKNSANEGQSVSFANIWSDEYAMVAKIARTQDVREPCLGRNFHWSADGSTIGGTVETYRDESVRGNIVRVRHDVDEKVIMTECAQLLDNITT